MLDFSHPDSDLAHQHLAAEVAGLSIERFGAPHHRHAIMRDRRFHYLDWGPPGAPPLLFLHGGGQTARTWDLVCLAMRSEFHCLALDLRGHGDSEWSYEGEYGIAAHTADVGAFADHLNLDRFVLVGMSLGCFAALSYATQNSARLAALVAVDAGPGIPAQAGQRVVDFMERCATLPSVEAYVEAALTYNPRRDPRLLRRSLLHNLRQLPDGTWTWKHDRRHRWDPEALLAELEPVWDRLGAIRCPTLVVRGAESHAFTEELAGDLAARVADGCWVTVENAGHTVQGDNPAGLVRELRHFLSRAVRGGL